MAHQIGEEEHRALQHADHEEVTPLVVAADLVAELGDAALQLLAGDEGLADRGVTHAGQSRAHPYQRSARRTPPSTTARTPPA